MLHYELGPSSYTAPAHSAPASCVRRSLKRGPLKRGKGPGCFPAHQNAFFFLLRTTNNGWPIYMMVADRRRAASRVAVDGVAFCGRRRVERFKLVERRDRRRRRTACPRGRERRGRGRGRRRGRPVECDRREEQQQRAPQVQERRTVVAVVGTAARVSALEPQELRTSATYAQRSQINLESTTREMP